MFLNIILLTVKILFNNINNNNTGNDINFKNTNCKVICKHIYININN